ncbi:hypothetical protein ACP70R_036287 [Stipagrostis hirtigluma subsp. patula]
MLPSDKCSLGVALASPLVLLASATATKIFASAAAPWIGGISLFVWLAASFGMIMNQFAETPCEHWAAGHLSRLGMLGLSVLVCLYAFFAFFPGTWWILCAGLGFAVASNGFLWSCKRREEDRSLGTGPGTTSSQVGQS